MSGHLSPEALDLAACGTISPDAQAHLSSCAECRRSVSDAKGLQKLLGGMKPYTLSDMAFRRVEAKLMEQAEEGLPFVWPAWLKFAVPVALAAAVAGVIWAPWKDTSVPATASAPTIAARPSPKTFSPMTVTFAALDAKVRVGDGQWEPLRAGGQLSGNSAFSGGRTVLATMSDPRLVLEAEGSFAVGGQAMMVLGAGSIGVSGDSEVLAGTRRVMSLDAAYRVERTAAEVALEVASGQVEMFDESTAQRRVVVAPARLRWADGTALDKGVSEPVTGWRIASAPNAPAAVLDLSGLPDGTLISIDGQLFGATPLNLMLDAGRHTLQVTLPGKPMQERFIDLVGGQPFLFALAPEAERTVEAPEPDAQALARVMEDLRRQTPKLRACYEKWLKANPSASGTIQLHLLVNAKGVVKSAEVKGDRIAPESVACLKTTAKTLVLSPLGSEQELELPLVFTPGKK